MVVLDADRNLTLPDHLFWDTNPAEVDAQKHKLRIMERVLTRGTLDEFKVLLTFYTREGVAASVKDLPWLDEKTMHFCAVYFNVPLTEMKCYTNRQSAPKRWEY